MQTVMMVNGPDPQSQIIELVRDQDVTLKAEMCPPQSISGWTIEMKIYDALGGASSLALSTASAITITDSGRGKISIAIADTDTSGLTVSKSLADAKGYVWDIKRTDSGSEVVLARGSLILSQQVF